MTTPNTSCWCNIFQILRGKQLHHIDWKENQNNHVRYFAPHTLKNELKKVGFKDVYITSVGTRVYTPNIYGKFMNFLIWILHKMKNGGAHIIAYAKK